MPVLGTLSAWDRIAKNRPNLIADTTTVDCHWYGFVLRKVPLVFKLGVDDHANVKSLFTNSSIQMGAQEYRQLVGDGNVSGLWDVEWSCSAG